LAVGLSVLSVFAQLEYFVSIWFIGPELVGVVMSWIFRIPFLAFVFIRLKITPEPEPGGAEFFPGLGGRCIVIQFLAVLGMIWQVVWFFSFLTELLWVGMVTSTLWMIWIYGMAVREQALCYQLMAERHPDRLRRISPAYRWNQRWKAEE
jgi:hypothetical protein